MIHRRQRQWCMANFTVKTNLHPVLRTDIMQRVLQHRYICSIKSLNGRRRVRQMLSFPDDRAVGITPILGRPTRRRHISEWQLLIFTTYVGEGASGFWQKLYFTLEKLPMRGFWLRLRCHLRCRLPVPLRVMQRKLERELQRLKFFCVSNENGMHSEGP